MKRKRKNMAKRETAKTNNDESYYKNFVIPCVIFLVGYYFSAHNGICYSDFTFVVVILFIVVFVVGIKCLIKSKINSYAYRMVDILCFSCIVFYLKCDIHGKGRSKLLYVTS